jgi:hypothetical protein
MELQSKYITFLKSVTRFRKQEGGRKAAFLLPFF